MPNVIYDPATASEYLDCNLPPVAERPRQKFSIGQRVRYLENAFVREGVVLRWLPPITYEVRDSWGMKSERPGSELCALTPDGRAKLLECVNVALLSLSQQKQELLRENEGCK